MAAQVNILVRSKRVPWVEDLPVEGPDYSAGDFKMEIRTEASGAGELLVTLATAAAGSEGISCTYDAAYPLPDSEETIAASVFLFQIDETTMEDDLAAASPADSPVTAYYDLHVTPDGGTKFLLCYGSFTYYPGVTQ